MATESVIQRSFAGGELSPAVSARADQGKYVTGLRRCRNFLVRREGGVTYRPGLRFCGRLKTASATVQLLRYVSEVPGESVVIECGDGYLRFWQQGALVRLAEAPPAWSSSQAYGIGDLVRFGGVNYYAKVANTAKQPDQFPGTWYPMPADILELPSPFGPHLPYWHQDGRVITLTHVQVRPHELVYESLTRWILRPVTTTPSMPAPTGLTGTAGSSGTRTYRYAVTAAREETYEESVVGSVVELTSAGAPTPDAPHVLTWTAVPEAAEYYLYGDGGAGNGVYGFIGTSTTTTFRDLGFTPDFAVTPPIPRPLFETPGDYPAISGSYQQRRWFAQTAHEPDTIWGSRVGFRSNFSISSPLQDDDAVTLRLAGAHQHAVRHLFGLRQLLILTDGGVWTLGRPGEPLTPSDLPAEQQTYLGVSPVTPVVLGHTVIYLQARGATIHDLQFAQEVQGLAGRDLTVYAAHLFERQTIRRLDYQHTPDAIVWAVRDDGVLLGLTYVPEQEVWGWHRHDTRGWIEDVCVVPEPGGDVAYLIVRRTIAQTTVRTLERLEARFVDEATFAADAFHVDSGLSYSGPPVSTVTGLDHLEGEVVAVVADGQVVFAGDPADPAAETYRVRHGAIALPSPASVVHVGLPYLGEIETLELDVAGASLRDRRKRVSAVSLLLTGSSRTCWAGPDRAHLRRVTRDAWDSPARAFTGQVWLHLTSWFDESGRLVVQQRDPLPLTILAVVPQIELGG